MRVLLSVDRMRQADSNTIDNGVPSIELMRRAAEGIYKSYDMKGNIAIVAGNGNNGGDGFALAEILIDKGISSDVFTFSGGRTIEAEYYYTKIIDKGIKVNLFEGSTRLTGYDIIIDCIFGTGIKREVSGVYYKAIESINNSGSLVISADIPSGINGDNGKVMDIAVKADITVSLGQLKTGHYLNDAMDYCGKIINYDIGIYDDEEIYLIEQEDIEEFFPKRLRNINKGTEGKLLIIGGCTNYMGALLLTESGAGALRVGAGLNCIAVARSHISIMLERITTSTLYPISDVDGYMSYDERELDKALVGVKAVAIGMGMGENKEIIKFIEHLMNTDIPTIIDADGLNALINKLDIIKGHRVILTPHPKEFSRLTGLSVREILDNPVAVSKEFAAKYNIVLLLKGASSIITDGTRVVVVDKGAPNMAKGGSGDVLSGIIGGLLSKGLEPYEAAYAGAYIAGRAGEIARDKLGEYSANPTDTVDNIAYVLRELQK